MRKNLTIYQDILRLFLNHPYAFGALLIVSLLAALSEGLGISFAIPLLETSQSSGSAFGDLPILGVVSRLASDLGAAERVRLVAIVISLMAVARGLLRYVAARLTYYFNIKTDVRLREKALAQVLEVELGFVHRQKIGNLFTILAEYTRVSGELMYCATGAIANAFTVLIYLVIVLLIGWQLTLLAGGLLLFVSFLSKKRLLEKLHQAGEKVNAAIANLNAVGFELLSGIRFIHLSSREGHSRKRFGDALGAFEAQAFYRSKMASAVNPLFSTLNILVLGVILLTGSYLLGSRTESWIGLLLLFLVILFRLMGPATTLNDMRARIVSFYPSLQAVLLFLRREDKGYLKNGNRRSWGIKDKIAFENVTFSYGAGEQSVLKNISLEIPKGKTTAVVGPSGAGKTTLVNLLARLYDCTEGRITVDEVDVRDLYIDSWRSQIAVVSQDTFIFNDTVEANLRFVREDATAEEIRNAAEVANAHEFIAALPGQYDTILGDRGVRLSGGQQQRIAIARAILSDPQVLILDEATSNLDTENERQIQEAINRVSQDRTLFVIAHRLSTIMDADHIIVLSDGVVVEEGAHDELMQLRGQYWKLVQMQRLEQPESTTIQKVKGL